MNHERILAVHDISCVGRCSLTVALPIISSVGIECSGLPTAVLSTHTGGFTGFTYRDLTGDMIPIDEHWKSLGITFDAFYTGFLGSFEQIDIVCKLIDDLSHEGTVVYVDPVMADAGKLYSIFGPDFPQGMRRLCEKADVLMPNLTELNFMLGDEWFAGPYTHEYIDSVLEKAKVFGAKRIVLTGISFDMGKVGAVYMDYETGEKGEVMRDEIPGYFHGTGDVFGSALVGACERGCSLADAVEAAVNLTVSSILRTTADGDDVRYGVNFEQGLRDYIDEVDGHGQARIVLADSAAKLRIVESLGHIIWNEAYEGLVSKPQIDYMLRKFQSFDALAEQVRDGYTYIILMDGGQPAGYCGYVEDGDSMFLSKMYIRKESRGKGLSRLFVDRIRDDAERLGLRRIHLTVKRDNDRAIKAYEGLGFVSYGTQDKDIGDGFVMYDYLMEMRFRCSYQRRKRT